MSIDNVQQKIKAYANNSYDITIATNDERFKPNFECFTNYCILRVSHKSQKRKNENRNYKTLLAIEVDDLTRYNEILIWAAEIKQNLLDPETADLYVFICPTDVFPNEDECTAIETDDQICRKYVQLKSETIEDILNRSFLANVLHRISTLNNIDPINSIFNTAFSDSISKEQAAQKELWKQTFLNPFENGSELLAKLLTKTANDHEA